MSSEKFLCVPKGEVTEAISKTIDIYQAGHQSQRHLQEKYLHKFLNMGRNLWKSDSGDQVLMS